MQPEDEHHKKLARDLNASEINANTNWSNLTHFKPMFHLYNPGKHHKTTDFPTFSRGYKMLKRFWNSLKVLQLIYYVLCFRYIHNDTSIYWSSLVIYD